MRIFVGLLFLSSLAPAAALTVGSVTNQSAANQLTTGTGIQREFVSSVSATGVTQSGDNLSFTSRLSFMSAIQVEPDGPNAALTHPRFALYQTTFTVEDATNIGYSLLFDILMAGYSSLRLDTPDSGHSLGQTNSLYAAGNFYLSVDGGAPTLIVGLSGLSTNTQLNTLGTQNTAISGTRAANVGSYTGTHTFTFSFESAGANSNTFFGNYQRGEAALRFGESPTYGGFSMAVTPGADGEPAANLGLFTTATAAFNGPISTPEPSTGLLAAAALLAAGSRRRKRR